MIRDAIIRTITRWLPTLDEARLREVEDFVLAKAIEQQDSAPADTVVPHDGERTHGGDCQGGGTVDAPAIDPLVPNNDRQDTGAPRPVEFVGRAGSSPAPDTRPEPGVKPEAGSERRSLDVTAGETAPIPAAGRHGAQRDAVTPLDPGHETPTGGDSLDTTPGLNSAELWSAEMPGEVDGRFDDGGES